MNILLILAIPEVHLQILGQPQDEYVLIDGSDMVVAVCQANGTGPDLNLTWLIDDQNIDLLKAAEVVSKKVDIRDNFFTFETRLSFSYEQSHGNVTCVPNGVWQKRHCASFVMQKEKNVSEEEEVPAPKHRVNYVILITIFGSVTILGIFCAILIWKVYDNTGRYPMIHDLQLPNIPSTSIEDPDYIYADENENSKETYDLPSYDKQVQGKMFNVEDLHRIYQMKVGAIYTRWMGTINLSSKEKRCVVVTTPSENGSQQNERSWDQYVKRMLDIPENPNIVTIEGFCVDGGKICLFHTHLNCKTLEKHLRIPLEGNIEKMPSVAMTITEVMKKRANVIIRKFLYFFFQFVHPGLSTKKILLTDQADCKLYDFCLTKDARNTVRTYKKQNDFFDYNAPPEVVSRSEYNCESDVWYVALVIWEILQPGSSPFTIKGNTTVLEKWPNAYEEIRNELLFNCWTSDCSLRPEISKIRSSFMQICGLSVQSEYTHCQGNNRDKKMGDTNPYERSLNVT
ncbi:Ephrin type-A receptor 10 [Apostichopus japonicus]|uniref:Ephrin type-A receptor 10 n=1 Tax=Stichopus japonicus TaxID=307972 RepID=A0A2G8K217_STIJA|nr:Ephrin type-A receptor 10 [Apostichopus japonicus]